jgi:hypothetical protein
MSRGPQRLTQREIARTIRAAAKSGVPVQELKITPDERTIRIILGSPVFDSQQQNRPHEGANEWDDVA